MTQEDLFNASVLPERLVLARASRGMTQKELAERVGVSQAKWSKVENGLQTLPDGALEQVTEVLKYPRDFFVESAPLVALPPTFYRKRGSMPAKESSRLEAVATIRLAEIQRLLRSVDLPEPSVPSRTLRDERVDEARTVATELRSLWGIPKGPIKSMVALLEDHGIVVIEVDADRRFDGVSFWPPRHSLPPMIMVSKATPGDRQRFTLAHELGHLILHRDDFPPEACEEQADAFAAELLAPTKQVAPFLRRLKPRDAVSLKRRWGVSMGALARRARELGYMSENQYRYFYVRLARQGYSRSEEPDVVPRETPTLLREAVDFHRNTLGYTDEELATVLHLDLEEWSELYQPEQRLRLVR